MTTSTMLDAALAYAEAGYAVLPLRPGTKATYAGIGVYDATASEDQVREWWGRHPNANIGLAVPEDTIVFDADTGEGHPNPDGTPSDFDGVADLKHLEDCLGSLDGAPFADTATNGLHVWAAVPEGMETVSKLTDGIQVKRRGGYVVAPPSIIRASKRIPAKFDGNTYRWGASILESNPLLLDVIWLEAVKKQASEHAAAQYDPAPPNDDEIRRGRGYAQPLLDELASCPPKQGKRNGRNELLNEYAFKLARLLWYDREWLRASLIQACDINGLVAERRCHGTLASAFDAADKAGPEPIPDMPSNVTDVTGTDELTRDTTNDDSSKHDGDEGDDGRTVVLTSFAEINDCVPKHVWEHNGKGRFQLGTVGLFAGKSAQGKSTAARWFVAQVTRGQLPGMWFGQPQNVAIIAPEELADATVKPSLRAAGADLNRTYNTTVKLPTGKTGLRSITDEKALTKKLIEWNVKVVVVDPITSTIGAQIDMNRNNEIRAVLDPYVRIAEAINGIVLCIAHLRKGDNSDNVLDAILGSTAFVEVTRTIFAFAADENSENNDYIMEQLKNSTGPTGMAFAYRLEIERVSTDKDGDAEVVKFVRGPETTRSVSDAIKGSDETKTQACTGWLEKYLKSGPRYSDEVRIAADDNGYGIKVLRRARRNLSVVAERVREAHSRTIWRLP